LTRIRDCRASTDAGEHLAKMADRFYINCALASGPVVVAGAEARHLAVVCRLRPGDAVRLFNGDGREYPAEVREVGKRTVKREVCGVEAPAREHPFRLEVAAPLPKGDRAPFLVEKLTELGATTFTPLQTARSVVQPREAKLDRLQRCVIEASKQCGRNILMAVGPLTEWTDFLRREDLPHRKVLAHPGGPPLARREMPDDVAAAVGPEGGFTDEEVESARAAGWNAAGLGPRILRVETAALVLAAWAGGI
jgi:16S rRNA (uracil1498-N3)-methyltransferase